MQIEAANRIGSVITIPEIPDRFKMLKIIGRGATSIVLEKDDNTVIVLTRDDIKIDWLNKSAVSNYLGSFNSLGSGINNYAFREFPIKAYSMPKLFPLNGKNKTRVRKIIKEFKAVTDKYILNRAEQLRALDEWIEEYEIKFNKTHELTDFKNFIVNYDESQFYFDLRQGNFMQDREGNIVVNDPVASKEIIDLINKNKKTRNPISRLSYDRGIVAMATRRITAYLGVGR